MAKNWLSKVCNPSAGMMSNRLLLRGAPLMHATRRPLLPGAYLASAQHIVSKSQTLYLLLWLTMPQIWV